MRRWLPGVWYPPGTVCSGYSTAGCWLRYSLHPWDCSYNSHRALLTRVTFSANACTPLLSAARQFVSVSVSLFLRDVFFIWIPMIARIGILFFAFLLLGVCLISWICEFLVLIMMRKFWAVISSILFLFLFSFFLGLLLPKC